MGTFVLFGCALFLSTSDVGESVAVAREGIAHDEEDDGRRIEGPAEFLDVFDVEAAMLGATGALITVGAASFVAFIGISAIGINFMTRLGSPDALVLAATLLMGSLTGILLVPFVGGVSTFVAHAATGGRDVGIVAALAAMVLGTATAALGVVLGVGVTAMLLYGLTAMGTAVVLSTSPLLMSATIIALGTPMAAVFGLFGASAGTAVGAFVGGGVDSTIFLEADVE
jgi:hypothetical protein